MVFYFAATQSKTHAFLLERKLKAAGVPCDLTYIPKQISTGVCNMGVRVAETYCKKAIEVIGTSGLPGCKVFMETINASNSVYYEMKL